MALTRKFALALLVGILAVLGTSTVAWAQTPPPGAAAPVPMLPPALALPPATSVVAIGAAVPAIADIPVIPVRFDYFGPSADVYELTVPPLIQVPGEVTIWSGPNATDEEADAAVSFGTRPAGSEFILFFLRGTRAYVFDVSFGDYAWVTFA